MITLDLRAPHGTVAATSLTLPFEARRRSRQRVRLDSGEDASVLLSSGEALRHGDLLASTSGLVVRVVAAAEPVMLVTCSHPRELARVAYHLGNRHVPVEVGEGSLKLSPDHVLRAMVEGLGAQVELISAPFDPETGAYGAHSHAGTVASRITGTKQAS